MGSGALSLRGERGERSLGNSTLSLQPSSSLSSPQLLNNQYFLFLSGFFLKLNHLEIIIWGQRERWSGSHARASWDVTPRLWVSACLSDRRKEKVRPGGLRVALQL